MRKIIPRDVIPHQIEVLIYEEDGEICWTLDTDFVEVCNKRKYPYELVAYTEEFIFSETDKL